MEHLSCEEGLRFGVVQPGEEKDLDGHRVLRGGYLRKMETNFLIGHIAQKASGNGFKLIEGKFKLDTKKKYFRTKINIEMESIPLYLYQNYWHIFYY